MSKIDGRISNIHLQIYNWLKELYPSFNIELEKVIVHSNQRIDIYIHQLQTAIEVDGEQHFRPVGYFVKTEEQWKDMVRKDKAKEKDLFNHGIRLVRIPYNHKLKSSSDLQEYINNISYPDTEFDDSLFINTNKEKILSKQREYSKSKYKEYSEANKEILKAKRKEAYRQFKERNKK